MTTTTPALRAAGMNDEQTECDACGRVELRGTVVVVDDDGNEVGRYGTTCASRILGQKITRSGAVDVESRRRRNLAHEIRAARTALAGGDVVAVRSHLREVDRFHVVVRRDEQDALTALRQAVA